jgi:hypothetical protein
MTTRALLPTAVPAVLLLACGVLVSCTRPEDPARRALRERLQQPPQLSSEELGRFREEIGKTIAGKTVRIREAGSARTVDEQQRTVILGMLTDPAGLFDEGLRNESGVTVRVLNAPGISTQPEIEAARRLWVDVATFVPKRFEFAYAFPGFGDYAFDLAFE